MKEALDQGLIELIESTISAKDFILSEVPDVVNQLLAWEMTSSAFKFSLFILYLSVYVFVNYRYYRKKGLFRKWVVSLENSLHSEFPYVISALCSAFLIMPSIPLISLDWLKIWIAPKVYLIEYTAELLK